MTCLACGRVLPMAAFCTNSAESGISEILRRCRECMDGDRPFMFRLLPAEVFEQIAVPGTKTVSKKGKAGSEKSTKATTTLRELATVATAPQTVADEPRGVRAVIAQYERRFEQRTGSRPTINWGRDSAIAKELIDLNGGDDTGTAKVIALLGRYFDSADDWICTKSGYTFPAFRGQVNRLAAGMAGPPASRVDEINTVGARAIETLRSLVP